MAPALNPRRSGRGGKIAAPRFTIVGTSGKLENSNRVLGGNAPTHPSGRSGGMADALDSKSSVRKGVWVRLPPSVLSL